MTEAEWLAATDPTPMLAALRGQASERKLRLFAVACCDRIRRLIPDPRSVAALQFACRHVETTPNRKPGRPGVERDAVRAHREAFSRYSAVKEVIARHRQLTVSCAAAAVKGVLDSDAARAAEYVSAFAAIAVGWEWVVDNEPDQLPAFPSAIQAIEHKPQTSLLRCIFGNPLRPVTFAAAWRSETAVALAAGIYANRAFDRLPILADALEEAGCDDADTLAHCRGPDPHCRGCWVVDGVLGKG